MIRVVGPKEKTQTLPNEVIIDVTSSSKTWSRELSPFILGPVNLYSGHTSVNFENAMQYANVYKQHLGKMNLPTEDYWKWAKEGWESERANRHPMGKETKPEYFYWDGRHLGELEARKQIYLPLYKKTVAKTDAYAKLEREYHANWKCMTLFDYAGYDFRALSMNFKDVLNDPTRKMGHAFILAMMLEEDSP